MALKQKVETRISLAPVPRILARTAMAGEFVKTLGGSASDVEMIQHAVGLGVLRSVSVFGLNAAGAQRENAVLEFDDNDSGDIMLDTSGGRSVLESIEPGLAKAISFARRQFENQGLTTETQFRFRENVYDDPDRLADIRRQLDSCASEPPPVADGYEERPYLSMRPGKDTGALVSMTTTRKRSGT